MTSKISLEATFEVWLDDTGERVEVGFDRDGLELIEVRHRSDVGHVTQSILLTEETASLLIQALQLSLEFRQKMRAKEEK